MKLVIIIIFLTFCLWAKKNFKKLIFEKLRLDAFGLLLFDYQLLPYQQQTKNHYVLCESKHYMFV